MVSRPRGKIDYQWGFRGFWGFCCAGEQQSRAQHGHHRCHLACCVVCAVCTRPLQLTPKRNAKRVENARGISPLPPFFVPLLLLPDDKSTPMSSETCTGSSLRKRRPRRAPRRPHPHQIRKKSVIASLHGGSDHDEPIMLHDQVVVRDLHGDVGLERPRLQLVSKFDSRDRCRPTQKRCRKGGLAAAGEEVAEQLQTYGDNTVP